MYKVIDNLTGEEKTVTNLEVLNLIKNDCKELQAAGEKVNFALALKTLTLDRELTINNHTYKTI